MPSKDPGSQKSIEPTNRLSTKAIALRILAYALLLFVVLPGAISVRWLYLPKHVPERTPKVLGLPFAEVEFTSLDGTPLSGWLVLPKGRSSARECRGAIVLCHGIGANRAQLLSYAQIAAMEDLAILMFDFRGHGESGGSHTTIGYKERLDVEAAIDFLKTKSGKKKVFLWGLSMGAAASALALPERQDVAGAILESPYDTLANTIAQHARLYFHLPDIPFGPIVQFWFHVIGGIDISATSPVDAVRKIDQPIWLLVVGSKQDLRMPPDVVQRVFDAANTPHKRLWISERGEHAAIMLSNGGMYKREVVRFFEQAFGRL